MKYNTEEKSEELEKIFSEYAMKNSIELKMQKKDYEIRKIKVFSIIFS